MIDPSRNDLTSMRIPGTERRLPRKSTWVASAAESSSAGTSTSGSIRVLPGGAGRPASCRDGDWGDFHTNRLSKLVNGNTDSNVRVPPVGRVESGLLGNVRREILGEDSDCGARGGRRSASNHDVAAGAGSTAFQVPHSTDPSRRQFAVLAKPSPELGTIAAINSAKLDRLTAPPPVASYLPDPCYRIPCPGLGVRNKYCECVCSPLTWARGCPAGKILNPNTCECECPALPWNKCPSGSNWDTKTCQCELDCPQLNCPADTQPMPGCTKCDCPTSHCCSVKPCPPGKQCINGECVCSKEKDALPKSGEACTECGCTGGKSKCQKGTCWFQLPIPQKDAYGKVTHCLYHPDVTSWPAINIALPTCEANAANFKVPDCPGYPGKFVRFKGTCT